MAILRPREKTAVRAVVDHAILTGQATSLKFAADTKFPPTGLDKFASAISSKWRTSRDMARYDQTVMAGGWQITKRSRKTRDRPTGGEGPADRASDDKTLFELRERTRSADRDSPLAHGIIDQMANNVIGPQYTFRPDTGDDKFNEDASALLAETSAATEHTGMFNFWEVQHTGIRSIQTDGDFLIHYLKDNKMQLIEAHDLVTPYSQMSDANNRIVGGVEKDASGTPIAYYVRDPSRTPRFNHYGWIGSVRDAQRIPAGNINHVANRYRFTQTRGVPNMASSLGLLERLDEYLDAETMAANLAAHMAWAISRTGTTALPGAQTVAAAADPNALGASKDTIVRSEPGQVWDLQPGEEIKVVESKRPGNQFEPYVVTMLRMIGAGIGIPLEMVLLDFSKTTYSSARASLMQAYRTFCIWQRFNDTHIIRPTYNRWMTNWIASGELRPLASGKTYKTKIYPSTWAWIDPLKSILAAIKRIEAGGGTLDALVAEDNIYFPDMLEARSKELKAMRTANVPTSTAPDNLNDPDPTGDNGNDA